MLSQEKAPLAVTTALGDDVFQLRSLRWEERLGCPFVGHVELASETPNIDLQALLKTPASIRIDSPDGEPTYFHGYICEAQNLGPELRLTKYSATLVPAIGLLKHSGGCRIFQEFTVVDIIKKIFSTFGFSGELETRLSGDYDKRDYCVQYCESDFNFLSRILESEGIYYFFEYSEQKHCMILADDLQSHSSADGNETIQYRASTDTRLDEYLTDMQTARQFVTGAVELGDYDFEKPRAKLTAKQASSEGDAQWTRYHYPGDFTESDRGQALAKLRQQSWDAAAVQVRFAGCPRRVRAGNVFDLDEHPDSDNNMEYLITESRTSASLAALQPGFESEFSFQVGLTCQPSQTPFRPPLAAKPTVIAGPHVAVVAGKADEEIWTYKYERIKVQFPWDPDGENDENSSCWIRVSQPWTGKTWGAVSLPRIGEEVIVQFVDGNPDRPIVVGRLNNADMMPPEALGESQAKTIFRTHSTKGGDQTNFHELTFDDTKDSEQIYLHSERDFVRVVENNDLLRVGFEKQTPGDQAVAIFNNQTIDIGQGGEDGSLTLNVQNNRTATITDGDDTTTVSNGNLSVSVESGTATIEAAESIELKCGGSTIKLTPEQISIESTSIAIKATDSLALQGLSTTVKADTSLNLEGAAAANLKSSGQATVKGAMVMIN